MRHLSCPLHMPDGDIYNLVILRALYTPSPSILRTPHKVDTIFIPILQTGKLDPRLSKVTDARLHH